MRLILKIIRLMSDSYCEKMETMWSRNNIRYKVKLDAYLYTCNIYCTFARHLLMIQNLELSRIF